MSYRTLIFFFFFFSSCSVFKNVRKERYDSTLISRSTTTRHAETSGLFQQQRVLVLSDSSDHQYLVEIIPCGSFHYSPSEGFTGSASSIRLSGRLKRRSSGRDSTATSKRTKTSVRADSSGHQNSKVTTASRVKEVKRRGVRWYWWVVGIVIVGGGYLRIYRSQ